MLHFKCDSVDGDIFKNLNNINYFVQKFYHYLNLLEKAEKFNFLSIFQIFPWPGRITSNILRAFEASIRGMVRIESGG